MHKPPCKSCKYTKESILMGHTLWYGAGKELASNLTAAWCRDSNTMAGIPCFVQRLPGLTLGLPRDETSRGTKMFPCLAVPLS